MLWVRQESRRYSWRERKQGKNRKTLLENSVSLIIARVQFSRKERNNSGTKLQQHTFGSSFFIIIEECLMHRQPVNHCEVCKLCRAFQRSRPRAPVMVTNNCSQWGNLNKPKRNQICFTQSCNWWCPGSLGETHQGLKKTPGICGGEGPGKTPGDSRREKWRKRDPRTLHPDDALHSWIHFADPPEFWTVSPVL